MLLALLSGRSYVIVSASAMILADCVACLCFWAVCVFVCLYFLRWIFDYNMKIVRCTHVSSAHRSNIFHFLHAAISVCVCLGWMMLLLLLLCPPELFMMKY